MESAQQKYEEMLLQPVAPTNGFHIVLGQLLDEGADEEKIEHMRELLVLPCLGPKKWEEQARDLASKGMISTVTENEALGAYLDDEPNQEWEVLVSRVIEKRKLAFNKLFKE